MDENKKDNPGYEPNFILKDNIKPDEENISELSDRAENHQENRGESNGEKSTSETSYTNIGDDIPREYGSFGQNAEGPDNPESSSYHDDTAGVFRDPRENFKSSTGNYGYGSYGGVNSSSENRSYHSDYSDYNNYGSDSDSSTDKMYNSVNDSSDYINSWNNGSDKVKRRRVKKTSSPISLTKKTLALIIALCIVLSGVFGLGGAFLGNSLFGDNDGTDKKASATTKGYTLEDATGSNMTVQEITESAKNSVVEIKTESVSSDAWMQQYVTEGAGSGVIITKDGYIVTNNHVIDGASKITVTTSDEKEYEAKLVGTDSITDVAVLKIEAKDLTPATYGNSDQLEVGDLAVAIGNPLGELGGTVTAGIISALDRQLSIDGKTMTLLQTDSSINPGNSGGGLFNGDGQLIGIVVAKSSGSDVEGLGFAIPINKAADVAQQLMEKGYVSGQPSTGMSYSEAASQGNGMSQIFGSQTSQSSVVYIHSVNGTNAKKAGFKEGDIVYAVDGTQITSFNELSSIVTSHKVGDKLTFTVIRNNQKTDIKLTLEEKQAGE